MPNDHHGAGYVIFLRVCIQVLQSRRITASTARNMDHKYHLLCILHPVPFRRQNATTTATTTTTTPLNLNNLCGGGGSGGSVGESLGVGTDVLGKVSVGPQELDVGTVGLDLAVGALLDVLLAAQGGETPVLGDDDLLATREPVDSVSVVDRGWCRAGSVLVLASPQSLESGGAVRVTCANGQEDLADVDTGHGAVRLTPGTTHTSLQSIGTSARQHLVDADDVEGVGTAIRQFFALVFARGL